MKLLQKLGAVGIAVMLMLALVHLKATSSKYIHRWAQPVHTLLQYSAVLVQCGWNITIIMQC